MEGKKCNSTTKLWCSHLYPRNIYGIIQESKLAESNLLTLAIVTKSAYKVEWEDSSEICSNEMSSSFSPLSHNKLDKLVCLWPM